MNTKPRHTNPEPEPGHPHFNAVFLLLSTLCIIVVITAGGCRSDKNSQPGRQGQYWPADQWRKAQPEDVGLNCGKLFEAELYLLQYPTQAFIVIRHGYIAFEGYYNGFSQDDLHDSYSIAKCFTSAAVGCAVKQGLIPSVQSRLADFITPHDAGTPNPEHYKQITIEHLLTMTSGIDYSNRQHYPQMINNDDWAGYVLKRPIPHQPGTCWKYKADPTLLSAVISKTANMNMFEYAKEHIFATIGIDNIEWKSDPSGNTSGNGDVFTTAENYARLGYLMLNEGSWNNVQVLPAGWVDKSTAPCISPDRAFCDCWSETPIQVPDDIPLEYGYAWWCRKFEAVPEDAYYAFGGKGQFILVIPSLDMVAVRLAEDTVRSDQIILPNWARLLVEAVE